MKKVFNYLVNSQKKKSEVKTGLYQEGNCGSMQ